MAAYEKIENSPYEAPENVASGLDAWFAVSGDMDDFIYFDDMQKKHSEK